MTVTTMNIYSPVCVLFTFHTSLQCCVSIWFPLADIKKKNDLAVLVYICIYLCFCVVCVHIYFRWNNFVHIVYMLWDYYYYYYSCWTSPLSGHSGLCFFSKKHVFSLLHVQRCTPQYFIVNSFWSLENIGSCDHFQSTMVQIQVCCHFFHV